MIRVRRRRGPGSWHSAGRAGNDSLEAATVTAPGRESDQVDSVVTPTRRVSLRRAATDRPRSEARAAARAAGGLQASTVMMLQAQPAAAAYWPGPGQAAAVECGQPPPA